MMPHQARMNKLIWVWKQVGIQTWRLESREGVTDRHVERQQGMKVDIPEEKLDIMADLTMDIVIQQTFYKAQPFIKFRSFISVKVY